MAKMLRRISDVVAPLAGSKIGLKCNNTHFSKTRLKLDSNHMGTSDVPIWEQWDHECEKELHLRLSTGSTSRTLRYD